MKIESKKFKPWEDRAVSPVIAVILMVAITVTLAGVISLFVLGIGTGDDPVDGAVDITVTDDTAGNVSASLEVIEEGNLESISLAGCADVDDPELDLDSGERTTVEGIDCDFGETINVIGEGPDGGEEIIGSDTV